MSPDATALLRAIRSTVQASTADRRTRLATVDPGYDPASYPGTYPRVTFDGETALTVKRFSALGDYRPRPGHRVLMIPSGTTYVIAGGVGLNPTRPVQVEESTVTSGISSTAGTPGSPACSLTFTAPPSGAVEITVSGYLRSATNTRQTNLSYEVRAGDASGSVILATSVYRGISTGQAVNTSAEAIANASKSRMLDLLTPGNVYFVRTMHWVSGGTGGAVEYRHLLIKPLP